MEDTTTLLEDLEDLVGQLQMEKIDEEDAINTLKALVKYYDNVEDKRLTNQQKIELGY